MRRTTAGRWVMAALVVAALAMSGCGEATGKGPGTPAAPGKDGQSQAGPKVFATLEVGSGKAGQVTALHLDKHRLWIGTRSGLKSATFVESGRALSLRSDAETDARFDGQEITALTGEGDRVLAATGFGFAVHETASGWTSEETGRINAVATFQGIVYAGRTTGIERRNAATKSWDKLVPDPPVTRNQTSAQHVLALAAGKDGEVWAGTKFGLLHYMPATSKWEHFYGAYQDIKSEKVVTDELGNVELGGNYINALRFDAATGKLLVATDIGISIFDGKWLAYTGEHKKYVVQNDALTRVAVKGNLALPSCEVHDALLEDSVVWIATKGGLARLAGTQLDILDSERGLPDDSVNALAFDAATKTLFAGTGAGVAVLGYE
ncbi:MAG: hypothetical protein HY303_08865 [Candidatus Wallbacteria bacterium]|nr:hypothetical protein [Candidatus Wallbacteria bacterium]